MKNYNVDADVEAQFPAVWRKVLSESNVTPQTKPKGILLGGQPGAGKSYGTMEIKKRLNNNVLIINGDEFRAFHKHFKEIYQEYGKDASKYTGKFAGAMVAKVRDRAIQERFNIVIEGTFRTVEVPLKELKNFKEKGYEAAVVICTCQKELSWESTIKRAEAQKEANLQPRYVPKEHHDLVVANLAKNVKEVFSSGVDRLEIYSRSEKLFDSRVNNPKEIEGIINGELQGLNLIKKEYQVDFSFNKEKSEKLGQKSYDVLVNGVRADEYLKKDSQLSKALEGLSMHKDIQQKGITAEALKSGTIQPLMLSGEFKVNRPEARIINATGSKIEPKKQEIHTEKTKGFSL